MRLSILLKCPRVTICWLATLVIIVLSPSTHGQTYKEQRSSTGVDSPPAKNGNAFLNMLVRVHTAYTDSKGIQQRDYNNFTASDFRRLTDRELSALLVIFATTRDAGIFIPQSFTRQYGDSAAGEMVLAVEREAMRRGKPELYATASLEGIINNSAESIDPNAPRVHSDVPASITFSDHSVSSSTAPKILNYVVAQGAIALQESNVAARQNGTYTP